MEQETLTVTYERLRHSDDSQELSRRARMPLPGRDDGAAFSRATALLEAVAGNLHTPVEDRAFLAEAMPFPNILVKLSGDPEPQVRAAVAANRNVKDWLAGRLTKDDDASVRRAALLNPQTSWKMRLEGAQDPRTDPEVLEYLGTLGAEEGSEDNAILSAMVRRSVALNPNAPDTLVRALAHDGNDDVSHAAQKRLS